MSLNPLNSVKHLGKTPVRPGDIFIRFRQNEYFKAWCSLSKSILHFFSCYICTGIHELLEETLTRTPKMYYGLKHSKIFRTYISKDVFAKIKHKLPKLADSFRTSSESNLAVKKTPESAIILLQTYRTVKMRHFRKSRPNF